MGCPEYDLMGIDNRHEKDGISLTNTNQERGNEAAQTECKRHPKKAYPQEFNLLDIHQNDPHL